MPVTKPASLTLKWWKANYPNSMPANKDLEAAIKAYETRGPSELVVAAKNLMKDPKSDLEKVKKDIGGSMAEFDKLVELLRRSKAMVTKAKHTDLAGVMEELAVAIKKERDVAWKMLEGFFERERERQGGELVTRKWTEKVTKLGKTTEQLKKAHATMSAISSAAAKIGADAAAKAKDKAADLAQEVGRNRFIAKFVTTESDKLDTELADAADALKKNANDAGAKAFLAAAKAAKPLFAAIGKESALLDKELVKTCVAALGDAVGKKLFMAAPEVKIKL